MAGDTMDTVQVSRIRLQYQPLIHDIWMDIPGGKPAPRGRAGHTQLDSRDHLSYRLQRNRGTRLRRCIASITIQGGPFG